MITKIKAYIRLQSIQAHNNRIETFANSIYSALYKKEFNDLDRAKVLEIVTEKMEGDLCKRKEIKMEDAHMTEMAHDRIRMLNIKY